jgi:hypothetical protein
MIEIWDERPDKPFDRDTTPRLERAELARRGVTDVAAALALVPDVTVREAGRGGRQIDVRGARRSAVKLLIDGVAVDDPFYGNFDLASLPATDLAQLRVATTPASPIDGAGGPGGVIELHTTDAIGAAELVARANAATAPGGGVAVTGRHAMTDTWAVRASAAGELGATTFALPGDDLGRRGSPERVGGAAPRAPGRSTPGGGGRRLRPGARLRRAAGRRGHSRSDADRSRGHRAGQRPARSDPRPVAATGQRLRPRHDPRDLVLPRSDPDHADRRGRSARQSRRVRGDRHPRPGPADPRDRRPPPRHRGGAGRGSERRDPGPLDGGRGRGRRSARDRAGAARRRAWLGGADRGRRPGPPRGQADRALRPRSPRERDRDGGAQGPTADPARALPGRAGRRADRRAERLRRGQGRAGWRRPSRWRRRPGSGPATA